MAMQRSVEPSYAGSNPVSHPEGTSLFSFWQNRISRSRLERHQPSLIRCECKFESCLRYYRATAVPGM